MEIEEKKEIFSCSFKKSLAHFCVQMGQKKESPTFEHQRVSSHERKCRICLADNDKKKMKNSR